MERLASALLTLSAIAIAGVLVHREFTPGRPAPASSALAFEYVNDWERLLDSGRLIGNATARVKVVEFMDLECPACRGFHLSTLATRAKHTDDVALYFLHMPLSYHRFAVPAARAVECAALSGSFSQMVDAIYAKQDSLGVKSWNSYAADFNMPDTARFGSCVSAQGKVARVEDGIAAARRVEVRGTPTIIVNGWRLSRPPTDEEFESAIAVLLSGGSLAKGLQKSPGT